MNKNLQEAIKLYSTKPHQDFSNFLLSQSKDCLIALFSDLMTLYINDKNSSTIREFLTTTIAGYKHSSKKIGFNGYKQEVADKPIFCEAKPKNISCQDFKDYKAGSRKNAPKKLNGGGSFTDYTWSRFNKDKKTRLNMLISGFIDGKLIYVLEFPFLCKPFTQNLDKQLKDKFPRGDRKTYYLRNASFTYKNYMSSDVKVVYLLSKDELRQYCPFIDKKFFDILISLGGKKCL
jgi:hypothetical protein